MPNQIQNPNDKKKKYDLEERTRRNSKLKNQNGK